MFERVGESASYAIGTSMPSVWLAVLVAFAIVICALAIMHGDLQDRGGRALRIGILVALALAYVVGLAAHLRCRPDDVGSVTRNELAIIFCGIVGALLSSALLVGDLAWTAAAAAGLIALELRIAGATAARAAA